MINLESLRIEVNYISVILESSMGEKTRNDFLVCFQLVLIGFCQLSPMDESYTQYVETLEYHISSIIDLNTYYSNPASFLNYIPNCLELIKLIKNEINKVGF